MREKVSSRRMRPCDLGRRIPVKVADPKLPSAEEVAEHELTHRPYRSWCSHCVRGKGKTLDPPSVGQEASLARGALGLLLHGSRGR